MFGVNATIDRYLEHQETKLRLQAEIEAAYWEQDKPNTSLLYKDNEGRFGRD
jgi:hypothetical protein